ncbi:STAS domain-containing protein [Actinoplanes sp. RD1]|uniref:STAS domain-containing protein n=1 Tax=Actinoplanes sp. RD1 TaxID=3064538 RepID=UPI00274061AF|nr:STAS domain-containing protein [Actinoplanes sp. RD1]
MIRSSWSADISVLGGTATVALGGELDQLAADQLRLLLLALLDRPGITEVVASLAAVTFLGSGALGALVLAYRHARELGRRFVVTQPGRPVRRVLEIGGVVEILVAPAPRA